MNTDEQVALPSTLKIDDPTTNSPEVRVFEEAIDAGSMRVAKGVFDKGGYELRKRCGDYLISLGLSLIHI
mgnify:CR=1 FL=1